MIDFKPHPKLIDHPQKGKVIRCPKLESQLPKVKFRNNLHMDYKEVEWLYNEAYIKLSGTQNSVSETSPQLISHHSKPQLIKAISQTELEYHELKKKHEWNKIAIAIEGGIRRFYQNLKQVTDKDIQSIVKKNF